MESTNLKGAIAEAEVAAAAVRLGVPVYAPVSEHGRSDLALEIAGRLWRVQCKWGRLGPGGDVIVIRVAGSRWSGGRHLHRTYDEHEIDLLGVYCDDLDQCYLLPVSMVAGKHYQHLRLSPPLNRQRACITLADDYAFEGAVAQLGERCRGTAEVRGSSPLSSTESPAMVTVGANAIRDHFGFWLDRAASGTEILVTRHGRPLVRLSPANPDAEHRPLRTDRSGGGRSGRKGEIQRRLAVQDLASAGRGGQAS